MRRSDTRLGRLLTRHRAALAHLATEFVVSRGDTKRKIAIIRRLITLSRNLITLGSRLVRVRQRLIRVRERLITLGSGVVSIRKRQLTLGKRPLTPQPDETVILPVDRSVGGNRRAIAVPGVGHERAPMTKPSRDAPPPSRLIISS
jgi:hypothetical protein